MHIPTVGSISAHSGGDTDNYGAEKENQIFR